jgi:HK97 family phage prohead protease
MKEGSAMLRSLPTGEERRDLVLSDAGVTVADPSGTGDRRFGGHAALFNTRTAIGNPRTVGFYESVAPGAFTKTLGETDARFLIDHSSYHVVSRASAGTLTLSQNTRGLHTDSALDQRLSYVNDLMANLDNGNIRGMSFGFQVMKDDWAEEEERSAAGDPFKVEVRTIREVKLIEVSAVTFPAYEETDAGLRFSLVPALRHRGDVDAIARAVHHRPELGPLLGYDPELAPTTIDLGAAKALREMGLIGEVLGNDTPIVADAGAMEPFEERDPNNESSDEPGETTQPLDLEVAAQTTEPAASTRDFDAEQYTAMAKARSLAVRLTLAA